MPLKKKYNIITIIAAVLLVSGCAGYKAKPVPQLVAEPNSVDLMIADAADRATKALETLAAMEHTKNPTDVVATVPNAPQELRRALTFDWSGPAEPLVQELARKAGYDYGIIGSKPPLPILINIRAVNKPLINILRDVGLQMGGRADLKVDAQMRRIEIHYADTVNGAES